jgi:hypothetical protein
MLGAGMTTHKGKSQIVNYKFQTILKSQLPNDKNCQGYHLLLEIYTSPTQFLQLRGVLNR